MKLVNFRHLKIGRRSRVRERKRSLTSIKDKIYLLKRSELAETASQKTVQVNPDDRETILADQGGAVFPGDVTVHELDDL
jgi:hypothetical protein